MLCVILNIHPARPQSEFRHKISHDYEGNPNSPVSEKIDKPRNHERPGEYAKEGVRPIGQRLQHACEDKKAYANPPVNEKKDDSC